MACVALPLVKAGKSIGVWMFFVSKFWAADEEIVALMARMAENVSFALDNFERAEEKAKADEQRQRLARMFAALSATNEAIMRAKSRRRAFRPGLRGRGARRKVQLHDHRVWLSPAPNSSASSPSDGPNADEMRGLKLAITDSIPEGRGLTGTAFRTRQPCISNDFQADERTRPWHDAARRSGARSAAALPLLNGDRAEGVHHLQLDGTGNIHARIRRAAAAPGARTSSFALENFDRADEKARAEKQKERLAGMFEALSATNEAIMRVKTRAELFELVCQAAVLGGMFSSATIALVEAEQQFSADCRDQGPE